MIYIACIVHEIVYLFNYIKFLCFNMEKQQRDIGIIHRLLSYNDRLVETPH